MKGLGGSGTRRRARAVETTVLGRRVPAPRRVNARVGGRWRWGAGTEASERDGWGNDARGEELGGLVRGSGGRGGHWDAGGKREGTGLGGNGDGPAGVARELGGTTGGQGNGRTGEAIWTPGGTGIGGRGRDGGTWGQRGKWRTGRRRGQWEDWGQMRAAVMGTGEAMNVARSTREVRGGDGGSRETPSEARGEDWGRLEAGPGRTRGERKDRRMRREDSRWKQRWKAEGWEATRGLSPCEREQEHPKGRREA